MISSFLNILNLLSQTLMDNDSFSFDLNDIEMKSVKHDEDSISINSELLKKKVTHKENKNDDSLLTKITEYLDDEEKKDKEMIEKLQEFEKKLDKML